MSIERDNIPELTIEQMEDKQGSLILLEQDSCGNIDRVAIHPIQLRYMAEKFGLIETSDPQAEKTIATLKRRLLLLNQRIQHLDNWLRTFSDTKHADLTYELGFSGGTSDMAEEFCAELVDTPANSAPPPLQPLQAPKPARCKPDASTVQASFL
jgi:hypothetical protein